jgi:hypothetical protein
MGIWMTVPGQPGEKTLCVKIGAIAWTGTNLSKFGGRLVLTNQRLYHGPLNVRLAGKVLAWQIGDQPVTALTDWIMQARAVDLIDIESVEPVRRSGLRITTRDRGRREFLIAATALTPVWSPKNTPHRDEMVGAVREAITRLGG